MGKMLRAVGLLIACLCVGTLLAQAAVLGYCWSNGVLSSEKMGQMMAVAQGTSIVTPRGEVKKDAPDKREGEISLLELARARAMRSRDFELREQSLQNEVDQLQTERLKLTAEANRYNQVKSGFEKQLNELRAATLSTNEETTRLILENMKPKQAKEQVMHMIDEGAMREVVSLLSAMQPGKRAKVLAEFKSPDESDKLAEILKLIRAGEPEVTLIDEAKKQAEPAGRGR